MAKRRTPPLFEVLSAPGRGARTGGGGGLGVATGGVPRRPVEVRVPGVAVDGVGGGAPGLNGHVEPLGEAARQRRVMWTAVCLILAGLLGIGFLVWAIAYSKGSSDGKVKTENELKPYLGPQAPPGGAAGAGGPVIHDPQMGAPAGVLPSTTPAAGSSGASPGSGPPVTPAATEPAVGDAEPRRVGLNYLNVVVLNWKDADRAAAYLTKNGVPSAVVANKGVDPATARAKNLPLLVVVLDGVPSDQFTASKAKRADLVEKVRRIGKRWQTEERGPSDFGEPFWAAFK